MSVACLSIRFCLSVASMVLVVGSLGCSAADASSTLGATPGGAQDEALANEKIQQGMVPNAEDITVEGMLASHDLPLEGSPCTKQLCIQSAFAVAPTLDDTKSAVFVQLGFSTGIEEATFHRSPLNLSVVVDRSGSMAGEKMGAVKTALSKLVNQLDDGDRLSIILFDDRVDVLLPSTTVANKSAILSLISQIEARGATNMSIGLREGFSQVGKYSGTVGMNDRVIVLTDAMVNTGSTDTAAFVTQANDAATRGIGLTVFGVGIDLNQELVLAVSKLRGGNYAFLSDSERISTVFDQDFDYLVTPLAYDLRFTLTPASGFRIKSVYGFPAWATGMSEVEIKVATVFLSRGHGAIVARLEPTSEWPRSPTPLAGLALTYQSAEAAASQSEVSETFYEGTDLLSNDTEFYSQIGVRRTVGYVNAALGMKQACSLYWDGRQSDAEALLDETEELLRGEAVVTSDPGLTSEAARASRLRANMQSYDYTDNYYDEGDDDVVGPLACSLESRRDASNPLAALSILVTLLGIGRRRRARSQLRVMHGAIGS